MRICRQRLAILLLLVAGVAWSESSPLVSSLLSPVITPSGGTISQPQTVTITPAVFAPLTTTPGWRTGVKYPGQGLESVAALSQDGSTVAAMRGRTTARTVYKFPGASMSPDN